MSVCLINAINMTSSVLECPPPYLRRRGCFIQTNKRHISLFHITVLLLSDSRKRTCFHCHLLLIRPVTTHDHIPWGLFFVAAVDWKCPYWFAYEFTFCILLYCFKMLCTLDWIIPLHVYVKQNLIFNSFVYRSKGKTSVFARSRTTIWRVDGGEAERCLTNHSQIS